MLIIQLFCVLCLLFGPAYWVKRILRKHSVPNDSIPGTGKQLIEHLLEIHNITEVKVEKGLTNMYVPDQRLIILENSIFTEKTLTAIAIAAHEFSHALQHHNQERTFLYGISLAKIAVTLQKIGSIFIFVWPILPFVVKSPFLFLLSFLGWILPPIFAILLRIILLPIEWDASFKKALPILKNGGYIDNSQEAAISQILTAAALTYVASALSGVLNYTNIFRKTGLPR